MTFEFDTSEPGEGAEFYYEGEEIIEERAKELLDEGVWYTLEDGEVHFFDKNSPDAPWNGGQI